MTDIGRPVGKSYETAAWLITGAGLLFTLLLHLLPALMAGLLVYELVHVLAPHLRMSALGGGRAKAVVVSALALFVVLFLVFGSWGIVVFVRSGGGGIHALLQKMAEIIEGSRETLPAWLAAYLPADAEGIKSGAVQWLRTHAVEVQTLGREAGRVAAHILAGMILGALISLREATPIHSYRPLARALVERSLRLSEAFRAVVFAQVRIAAVNTFFTWFYLGVLLPLFGIHLPLVKTMVLFTFVAGLLPVVGNLVSNSVVVVVSLAHSLSIALSSFVFLVVIHKTEYFLNARIVGSRIHARVWEILLALLVMEAAFGIGGLVAAPIYYAYLKRELSEKGLV
jgi:predicted PurR-regulated permease PerM